VPFNALPGFTNNTATGNTNGDYLAISAGTLNTTLALGPANSLNNGAFVLVGDITIGGSGVLNLAAGTVFKASGLRAVGVDGALHCAGTAANPVVFTSLDDDAYAGDTNKNGAATSPSAGQWHGLSFTTTADASTLDNVRVRYAGNGSVAAVALAQADISLTHATIEFSAWTGLFLGPTTYPIVNRVCLQQLRGSGARRWRRNRCTAGFTLCTAAGNAGGNYIRLASSNVTSNEVLAPANTLNATGVFVFASSVTVNPGVTLTLPAGDILKWTGTSSGLFINGTVTCNGAQGNPVVFTSIDDDSAGGDTTNNGPTVGSPGTWRGIATNGGAGPCTLTNVVLRYGGASGLPAISLIAQGAVLSGVSVQSCQGAALDLSGNARPTVSGCTFSNNARAVDGVPLDALTAFTGNTASGNSGGNYLRVTSGGAGVAPVLSIGPANLLNGTSGHRLCLEHRHRQRADRDVRRRHRREVCRRLFALDQWRAALQRDGGQPRGVHVATRRCVRWRHHEQWWRDGAGSRRLGRHDVRQQLRRQRAHLHGHPVRRCRWSPRGDDVRGRCDVRSRHDRKLGGRRH